MAEEKDRKGMREFGDHTREGEEEEKKGRLSANHEITMVGGWRR